MPDGLSYVDSWIEATFDRCFQVMETDDPELFRTWTSQWDDLMDFEIIPIVSSAEMRERFV
jgi:hypothetical protein